MAIEFACAECGTRLRVPDEKAGAKGRCPRCREVINIPELDPEPEDHEDDPWLDDDLMEGEAMAPPSRVAGQRTPTGTSLKRGRSPYSYRPQTALVWTISILMSLLVLLCLFSTAATFYQLGLLNQVKAGEEVPQEQLELSDAMILGPGCFQILIYIALGIVWCVWKVGCNKNARALSGNDLEYTPGWCAGCYFVPFANLVWPYKAMKEIWENSAPSASTSIVGWWWGLWLINNFVGNAVMRMNFHAESLDELIRVSIVNLAVTPLELAVDAVALVLVWKLYVLQQQRADLA